MNLYRAIGERVGTLEARELAEQLMVWHDSMVKHLRVAGRGQQCVEDCAHEEARLLWSAAIQTFGEDAATLSFLRTYGDQPPPPSPDHALGEARE